MTFSRETPSPRIEAAAEGIVFSFRHFPELDGLRGLAIILVVAGHALYFDVPWDNGIARLGVLLFFVLSGFLITGLLTREKLQTGRISLTGFYLRRGLRLFPALFVYLLVVTLLLWSHQVEGTTWYTLVACLLYVRNIWGRGSPTAHIWSLSLEEQFYACWPWVVSRLGGTAVLYIGIVGTVSVSVFRMVAIHWGWFDYRTGVFESRPWFRIDSILLGCVMAMLFYRPIFFQRLHAHFSGVIWPMALWPIVIAWSIWGENYSPQWFLTIQMVLVFLIIVNLLVARKSVYLSAFSHPLATWIGRISYSWYLWQQIFVVILWPRWGGLRRFPLNIVASLALAVASQRFIEGPFLRIKGRLAHDGTFKWWWDTRYSLRATAASASPPQENS